MKVGLLCALTASAILNQQAPVFKSGVDLIALDVTVVDKDGKPVQGLKATDFVVTLNGKAGTVRQMDYLTYGAPPGSDITIATGRETSNTAPASATASRGGRVIVLLIDDLAAKVTEGKMLMIAAERILNTLDLGDMVGLTTTSGLGPAISPTRDRAAVLAALKSREVLGRNEDLTQPFYVGVHEALEIDRGFPRGTLGYVIIRECSGMDASCADRVKASAKRLGRDVIHRSAMQLRAYAEVITALKLVPAPRVVIALSTGVAPGADDAWDRLGPVSRAAAESGVQFYALTEVADPIDLRDQAPPPPPSVLPLQYSKQFARKEENAFLTSGVQVVAHAAGGEAWRVVGQADRFFKRIISETSGIYRLGVETTAGIGTSRFLDAKVSVKRSGVTVRAHRHAILPTATAAPLPVDEALRARIASGGVAFGVPIALATALRRDPAAAGQVQIGVNIQMPASVAAPLVAMFALVDSAGKIVNAGRQPVAPASAGEDYQLAFPISVASGEYRLRFAVADAAGNIGSVEQQVVAKLVQLGGLSVSDLVTTWIGPDGNRRLLALETLPDGAVSLRAFLELYPDAPAADLAASKVRIELLRTGETTPAFAREVTPVRDGSVWSAGAEIPVDALPPGNYSIRATVMEGGTVTGTVTTHVRKAG